MTSHEKEVQLGPNTLHLVVDDTGRRMTHTTGDVLRGHVRFRDKKDIDDLIKGLAWLRDAKKPKVKRIVVKRIVVKRVPRLRYAEALGLQNVLWTWNTPGWTFRVAKAREGGYRVIASRKRAFSSRDVLDIRSKEDIEAFGKALKL